MRGSVAQLLRAGVVLAALVAACGGSGGTPSGPSSGGADGGAATAGPLPSGIECGGATCHYDDALLGFDYPASWRAAKFEVVSSFSYNLVYLSTSPLSDPCDRSANTVACVRLAASSLAPGGLVLTWVAWGFPNWSFDPNAGTSLTVGGRQSTLEQFDATESCRAVGGSRELRAIIPRPAAQWNWMEMDACLAGPDTATATTQIEAMLSTVIWKDTAQP